MTDRPINLHAHEVNAIREGRQTQLRRVLKPQPIWSDGGAIYDAAGGQEDYIEPHWIAKPKHPYAVGAKLWVREAWTYINHDSERGLEICIGYNADGDSLPNRPSIFVPDSWGDRADYWAFRPRRHSSIHMPRWASRLTLIVSDVRVQRLQEISEEDAIAEGVEPSGKGAAFVQMRDALVYSSMRGCFAALWNSINAKRPGCSWDDNPWIVALTFRSILENIDQIGHLAIGNAMACRADETGGADNE
ncbi:MAG: hypothetical protein AB7L41_04530 [Flavobacteriaceae bacterium]